MVNLGEGRIAYGLNSHAVDHRAFGCLNAEEVLAIRVDREYLVKDLSTEKSVVDCELYLGRRSEAVSDVDVED